MSSEFNPGRNVVQFDSDGSKIAALLFLPDDYATGTYLSDRRRDPAGYWRQRADRLGLRESLFKTRLCGLGL